MMQARGGADTLRLRGLAYRVHTPDAAVALVVGVVEDLDPVSLDRRAGPRREAGALRQTGVTEYWLVDPIAETVTVDRQRVGVLAATRTFGRQQMRRSPLLAGLELHLDEVFSS